MKTTLKLICSFILIIPGVYAIVRWSLMDYKNYPDNAEQRVKQYLSVFPMLHLGFIQLLEGLLVFGAAGTALMIPSFPAAEKRKKASRLVLLVIGSAETGLLLFSLM